MIWFEVVMIGFLLLVLVGFFLTLLWRAFVLFPVEHFEKGRLVALEKYRFSLFFVVFLSILEIANLTGFSWQRMRIVSDEELINSAIDKAYHGIYRNKADLKKDYSKFEPQVRYWGSWNWKIDNDIWDKLLGFTRYQVLLPDDVFILDVAGEPLFTRPPNLCDSGDAGCPIVIPDNPEQGIVGTVQLGSPDHKPALTQDIAIEWNGEVANDIKTWGNKTKNGINIRDHCFSAYIKSPQLHKLEVRVKGEKMVEINQGYGFYLVTIQEPNSNGVLRISREEFLKSQKCDPKVRQEWPNMGGNWIR